MLQGIFLIILSWSAMAALLGFVVASFLGHRSVLQFDQERGTITAGIGHQSRLASERSLRRILVRLSIL